jgi:hypothetical protein
MWMNSIAGSGRPLVVALLGLMLAGCRSSAPPAPAATPGTAAGPAGVVASQATSDLAGYCQDLHDHPFLGSARREELTQALASVSGGGSQYQGQVRQVEQAKAYFRLGQELLNQGQLDQAAAHLDTALQMATAVNAPADALDQMLLMRALIGLRRGEVENCINAPDPGYPYLCLLFTGAEGAYPQKDPIQGAAADLEAALRVAPQDTTALWLLNVAHMLLGSYPDGVPAAWRIPPERFASPRQVPRFRNVAADLGVNGVNQLGGSIMEDFDNDGFLDILTTTYHPCKHVLYYHNDGNGRMSDRSVAAGLGDQLGGFNAQQTDYNNDGFMDVFITRGGWQADAGQHRRSLLRNNGDGTFSDVSHEAGVALPTFPSQASAWADYDNDGDVDVYVGSETSARIPPGQGFPAQLYRNNGDGTFTDVAQEAGVTNDRMAKGVAWGDYDNDGDPDLYVSNIGPNRLYRNNGDGSFADVAAEVKVMEPSGRSFAPWFFDYNNDGWLDLFVAGYDTNVVEVANDYMGRPFKAERPRLYRNDGQGGFEDVTEAAGLKRALLPMGSNFGDMDNDGWLDFYLGTGDPNFQTLMPNVMFWNEGGQRFLDVTQAAAVGHLPKGHGIAFGDLDNDGDQDIYLQAGGFVTGDTSPNALFENPGAGNHWLTAKLVGERSNRAAIGARVTVTVTEGARQRPIHLEVTSGSSFGANSLQLETGLGQAEKIDAVEVFWPTTKTRQVFRDLAVDQFLEIHEGEAVPRLVRRPRLQLYRAEESP